MSDTTTPGSTDYNEPPDFDDEIAISETYIEGLLIVANGFITSPLTVNGIALTNGTYVNQSTSLSLGTTVNFVGTDKFFFAPYNFTTTYEFVPAVGSATPEAVLEISGLAGVADNTNIGTEAFSGQFIGYGDPNLPANVSAGTTIVVAPPGSQVSIVFGTTVNSMTLNFTAISLPLFTSGSDVVNFNTLTSSQIVALEDGANPYNTLDGDDTVTIPTVANATNLGGSGVSYNLNASLALGSGNDIVYGSDGPTNVTAGTGIDTIYLNSGLATLTFLSAPGDVVLVAPSGGSAPSADVVGFTSGDTIDLRNIIANDAVFNPATGTLDLYDENWGTGSDATLVGTITFAGIQDSLSYGMTTAPSFALASDGAGGSDITLGAATPDVATLAALSDAAYQPGFSAGGYTVVAQDSDPSNGFFAEEFQLGDQIVLAIEGTNPDLLSVHGILNLAADESWIGGTPTSALLADVADAANFLADIRQSESNPLNQYDNITITGHSLGGALAQLLGEESNYTAVGFDAPGAMQFFSGLYPQLKPAYDVSDGITRINSNYRMAGDQVSLSGTSIGTQFTIQSRYADNWANVLNAHSMDFLNSQIDTGAPIVAADSALSASDIATEALLSTTAGKAIFTVDLSIMAVAHYYEFDPSGDGAYQIVESAPSPAFSSFLLPANPGVSTYTVSFFRDGQWTPDQSVAPATTISVPAGDPVTGFSFTPEDANQNIVSLPDGLSFEASFASTGTFEGTLTETVACYLPGTQILTDHGEVAVEKLAVGDGLVTVDGFVQPLCWIGCGRALATRGRRGPSTPVIVRKNALADNVPSRDLSLTKGHSLYIDGILIPVEYLVNHHSIIWDDHTQEVTVYHLELENHNVVLANGAAAETYRDDGNRWLFQNGSSIRNDGWKAPFAPVLTGGPIVDGIWRRLLGRVNHRHGFPLTDDADVHLVVDGVRFNGNEISKKEIAFQLSGRSNEIRLISNAAVPQELGLARDPRCLGVAIKRITVAQRGCSNAILASDPRLTMGFHEYEADLDIRWTDGNALLPLEICSGFDGKFELLLELAATATYIEGAMPIAA